MHLLEFSCTSSFFDHSLLHGPESCGELCGQHKICGLLQQCRRDLEAKGFPLSASHDPRVLPSKAKIFVAVDVYADVLKALEEEKYHTLNGRHVIVSDRYLEAVRACIFAWTEANTNKGNKRRCIAPQTGPILDTPESMPEEVKHTFIHVPTRGSP